MDKKIPGVGVKTEQLLEKIGITTMEDLLHHYPDRYTDFPVPVQVAELSEGKQAIQVIVDQSLDYSTKVPKVRAHDATGAIWVSWFHPPFAAEHFRRGEEYVFLGEAGFYHGYPQMRQPLIYTREEYDRIKGTLQPVYPSTKKLAQATLQRCTRFALEKTEIPETLPGHILDTYDLCSRKEALWQIHYPKTKEEQERVYRRIVFEEFYWFRKEMNQTFAETKNTCKMSKQKDIEEVIQKLPYPLTKGQKGCFADIRKKVKGKTRMNMLIQGDVGCGKTILAILSMLLAAQNGYQAVLMAPTEVLATQHYEELSQMLQKMELPYTAALLTGSTKKKPELYEKLQDGTIQLLIGTHAVLTDPVEFANLGLVITDEQHRFGVKQREALEKKGCYPHNIVMSATPIPRSLGLILYGDMDICNIYDKPANRLPIQNCMLPQSERRKAWRFLYHELERGHQAYIICPMIEENEKFPVVDITTYYKYLRQSFPEEYEIAVLHGHMKPAQKEQIMNDFQENKIQILLSTTVVEVGVNVPNATVILIENGERFGMAQLHQLRGRVGRGKWQSYCIFLDGGPVPCERLQFLSKTNDGFQIAEEDMKARGVGEFFGERQAGDTDFLLADLYKDTELLKLASEAAKL